MLRRIFCAFLAGGAVCFLLVVFLFLGPGKVDAKNSIHALSVNATAAITISEPTLSPTYSTLCDSAWYSFTTNLSSRAYLTLNVVSNTDSGNSGVWRPEIQKAGYYLVEAYIPAHDPIFWKCTGDGRTVNSDTASATYTIHSGVGSTRITVNQSAIKNAWKILGKFAFQAGNAGWVSLDDITGEEIFTHTVSFSAMRFTYIGPALPVYFPFIANDTARSVRLESVSALDKTGKVRNAFVPQEVVYWTASGVNNLGSPREVTFTSTLESPCAAPVYSTGKITLPTGNWSRVFTMTMNTCTGLYNFTYQIDHQGYKTSLKAGHSVNLPGFDICTIPTIPQMQIWWDQSPYYAMNLYTGGASLSGCVKVHPDANWVQQASQQGWTFIPTWVGLQAPCYSWLHPMDWDPNKSRQQGINEANQAAAVSRSLGFNGNHTIYYDLEYFPTSNATCVATVRSFLQGWIDQMHTLNLTPGLYGIASDFNRWVTLNPPPDRVWLAAWYSPYFYDPNASPWMPGYLSNNLWSNHQRLRQYNGDHYETWGSVKLGIDSDIADTNLVSTSTSNKSQSSVEANNIAGDINPGPSIQAFQQMAAGHGWELKSGILYWTKAGGESWQPVNSPDMSSILAADFLSETQGWAASRNQKTGAVQLYQTGNGGETWVSAGPGLFAEDPPVSSVSLSFLDAQTGWAAYTFQTSSAFSSGILFSTNDGGMTWTRLALPAAGKIRFTSPSEGWLQGGAGGDEVYQTSDGGRTWQLLEAGTVTMNSARLAFMGLPADTLQAPGLQSLQTLSDLPVGTLQASFSDIRTGWALVQEGNCSGTKLKPGEAASGDVQPFTCTSTIQLQQTEDGGRTWSDLSHLP